MSGLLCLRVSRLELLDLRLAFQLCTVRREILLPLAGGEEATVLRLLGVSRCSRLIDAIETDDHEAAIRSSDAGEFRLVLTCRLGHAEQRLQHLRVNPS